MIKKIQRIFLCWGLLVLLLASCRNENKEILSRADASLTAEEIKKFVMSLDEHKDKWIASDTIWDKGKQYGMQRGILRLRDGSLVRFAFLSHHMTDDIGDSVFVSENYYRYVKGWFCCEIEFGEQEQFGNLKELDRFLKKHSGIKP